MIRVIGSTMTTRSTTRNTATTTATTRNPYWNRYGDYGYDYTDYEPAVVRYDYFYQWSPEDQDWTEVKGDKAETKGAKRDHSFALLETSSGKTVLVDFGPKAQLDKVKLQKGNKIQVRGPREKPGGKYVLVAHQVSAINRDKKDKKEKNELHVCRPELWRQCMRPSRRDAGGFSCMAA